LPYTLRLKGLLPALDAFLICPANGHYLIAVTTLAMLPDLLPAKIKNLFECDLALQNDYLRQENKILRSKLGKRVVLNDSERRLLVI
jgi:hypothetical protein